MNGLQQPAAGSSDTPPAVADQTNVTPQGGAASFDVNALAAFVQQYQQQQQKNGNGGVQPPGLSSALTNAMSNTQGNTAQKQDTEMKDDTSDPQVQTVCTM